MSNDSNDYFLKLLINESEELEFNLDNNNSNGNRVVVVRNGSENELLSGDESIVNRLDSSDASLDQYFVNLNETCIQSNQSFDETKSQFINNNYNYNETNPQNDSKTSIQFDRNESIETNNKSLTGSESLNNSCRKISIIETSDAMVQKRGRGRPKKECTSEQRILEIKQLNKKSAKIYRKKKRLEEKKLSQHEDILRAENQNLRFQLHLLTTRIQKLKEKISHRFNILIDEQFKQTLEEN